MTKYYECSLIIIINVINHQQQQYQSMIHSIINPELSNKRYQAKSCARLTQNQFNFKIQHQTLNANQQLHAPNLQVTLRHWKKNISSHRDKSKKQQRLASCSPAKQKKFKQYHHSNPSNQLIESNKNNPLFLSSTKICKMFNKELHLREDDIFYDRVIGDAQDYYKTFQRKFRIKSERKFPRCVPFCEMEFIKQKQNKSIKDKEPTPHELVTRKLQWKSKQLNEDFETIKAEKRVELRIKQTVSENLMKKKCKLKPNIDQLSGWVNILNTQENEEYHNKYF